MNDTCDGIQYVERVLTTIMHDWVMLPDYRRLTTEPCARLGLVVITPQLCSTW
jgi:hypothetical protein